MVQRRFATLVWVAAALCCVWRPAIGAETLAADGRGSLAHAAAASRLLGEHDAFWSELVLRSAYDGAEPALAVIGGWPRRKRLTMTHGRALRRGGAGTLPVPAGAIHGPTAPAFREALLGAIGPFKAVLDLAWEGSWGGWTRLTALRSRR